MNKDHMAVSKENGSDGPVNRETRRRLSPSFQRLKATGSLLVRQVMVIAEQKRQIRNPMEDREGFFFVTLTHGTGKLNVGCQLELCHVDKGLFSVYNWKSPNTPFII